MAAGRSGDVLAVAVLAAILAAGCAGGASTGGGAGRAPLRSIDGGPAPAFEVRYDPASGQCTAGALQLLDRDAVRQMSRSWDEVGEGCTEARKLGVPPTADYPALLQAHGVSGGAHVLVRIGADGAVHDARAICASDSRFAEAAEATARAIGFAPATCGASPVRSAFLLPFKYEI